MSSSFLNLTVKTALNVLIFDEVTDKTKLAPFYGSRCKYVRTTSECHVTGQML